MLKLCQTTLPFCSRNCSYTFPEAQIPLERPAAPPSPSESRLALTSEARNWVNTFTPNTSQEIKYTCLRNIKRKKCYKKDVYASETLKEINIL